MPIEDPTKPHAPEVVDSLLLEVQKGGQTACGAIKRKFTDSEERYLTGMQKDYLIQNPNMVSLQPNTMLLPGDQLYGSLLHGAVTINRAMELDEAHKKWRQGNVARSLSPIFDGYSNEEDTFIERHGMSNR